MTSSWIKNLGLTMALLTSFAGSAHDNELSPASRAELGLHRLERLVLLGKVQSSFKTKFSEVTVTKNVGGHEFTVLLKQVTDTDKAKSVKLTQDHQGSFGLKFEVIDAPESQNAPVWAGKDPITLSELSLHYFLDNAETDTELHEFKTLFSSLNIAQVTNSAGETSAEVTILKTTLDSERLIISLALDGTVLGHKILGPDEE